MEYPFTALNDDSKIDKSSDDEPEINGDELRD